MCSLKNAARKLASIASRSAVVLVLAMQTGCDETAVEPAVLKSSQSVSRAIDPPSAPGAIGVPSWPRP